METYILMYHCVYDKTVDESGFQNNEAIKYKIRLIDFEKQVIAVCRCLEGQSDKRVLFSFDDGGVSFYTVIAPILEKYGLKGLFFITTSCINKPGFLSEKQILELYSKGHIIGSHSHTHPEMMNSMSENEIFYEWSTSCKILENIIGEKIIVASIPNGFTSKLIIDSMVKCGIKYIYTSKPSVNPIVYNNSIIYGRYVVTNEFDVNRILSIISSNLSRNIVFFRYRLLEILKNILGKYYLRIRTFLLKNRSK